MGLFTRRKALLIAFVSSLLCFLYIYLVFFKVPRGVSSIKVTYFKKGTPLWKISEKLAEQEIIRNRYLFFGAAVILGKRTEIKAGEYELHTHMRPLEVLDILTKGQVKRHLITVVEGYTLLQIAQLLQDLKIVEKKAFLEKASLPSFISSLGLPNLSGSTLEGYLFPETYYLIREMEPEEVIQMMVHQFKKVFGPELETRAAQIGISPRQAVILASIIEKETPSATEKPLVSAVLHNRLRKKILLQSDPTVIYGLKDFDGNLTKEDLLRPTPYNTYLIHGLPPTPICNPGKDSILAALYPAPVPYLYFVSKNNGSHYFSSNLEEHHRAVWQYQKLPNKKLLDKEATTH